jgi:putative peptidoglycan lipid II flippase
LFEEKRMSLARNVATVGSATLLSRLLGFFRDVGIAAVLGAGVLSDAYFAALQIPNLFRRLLAEGALNSAFVPMWLRIRDESGPAGARRFGEDVLGTMIAGLGAIAIVSMIFAPAVIHLLAPGFNVGGDRYALAVHFIQLSMPYVAFAGMISVIASVLNAEGRVGAAAFGLVVFNGVMVTAVLVVLALGANATSFAGAILSASIAVAGLVQLIVVGVGLLRQPQPPVRPRFRPSAQARHFFAQVGPGVLAGGAPQLKLMAGAMVASSSQASVSWLYYANRLYELPLGVVSIAIASVLVPLIAASVRDRDTTAIAAAQSRAFEIALGLALPSAAAFALLAEPIAGGLFERGAFGPRDTAAVAAALAAISAGLPGHVLEKVLGAVSFAHEDTRTPMIAALCGLATATAGALLLFPTHGHVGIAAAIAFSGWIGATILCIVLIRRKWLRLDSEGWNRLPRIVIATAIMAAIIYLLEMTLRSQLGPHGTQLTRILLLAVLVVAGLASYLTALQTLGVAKMSEILAALREKF